jgi:hypothetical protein
MRHKLFKKYTKHARNPVSVETVYIYPFYLKILGCRYRFLGPPIFKKLTIGLAIPRFLKIGGPKNQVAKTQYLQVEWV